MDPRAVTLRLRPSWQAVLRREYEWKYQEPVAESFKRSWEKASQPRIPTTLKSGSFWRPSCIFGDQVEAGHEIGTVAPPSRHLAIWPESMMEISEMRLERSLAETLRDFSGCASENSSIGRFLNIDARQYDARSAIASAIAAFEK